MRLFLFLFVILGLVNNVLSQTTKATTTADSTTVSSSSTDSSTSTAEATIASTSTSSNTGAGASSKSTSNGGLTTTASGMSVSTTAESTTPLITTTTTIITTTEPAWAVFDVDCDSEPGYCYYNISAPQLDKEQYQNQEQNLTSDQGQYNDASKQSYTVNSTFEESEAYANYTQLVETYKTITENYKNLIDTIASSLDKSKNVSDKINLAWNSLNSTDNGVFSDTTSCYYQRCARFTTTTTTTTTTRPTTTTACNNHNCTILEGFDEGTCSIINGKPTCTCQGNLDPLNGCDLPKCYPSLSGKPDGNPGPLWSVGYERGSETDSISYAPNSHCLYKISVMDSNNVLNINLNDKSIPTYNLDPTSYLKINGNRLPSDGKKVQQFIDMFINPYPPKSFKIEFKSGNVKGTGWYFDFDVTEVPSLTPESKIL